MSTTTTLHELDTSVLTAAEGSPIPTADTQVPTAPAPSALTGSFIRVETNLEAAIWSEFMTPFMNGRERFAQGVSLTTEVSIDDLFAGVPDELVTRDSAGINYRVALIETPDFAVLIQRYAHNATATVRAATRDALAVAVEQVTAWFPEPEPEESTVPVDFWQCGHSMHTTTRSIDAPEWTDVAHHYPGEVGTKLDALMNLRIKDPVGRVLLWHGRPGTGKTSAIRTLARAWERQARIQVVLDPESAFAGSTALMQMLLADERSNDDRWRILVIEDADPLVSADGNARTLSRLLNVGDGIVGQGLRVMVLLTTNQPPARLHPALGRPGRCLSEIEFRRFAPAEAAEAFPEKADLADRSGDVSLAEILTGTDAADFGGEGFGNYL